MTNQPTIIKTPRFTREETEEKVLVYTLSDSDTISTSFAKLMVAVALSCDGQWVTARSLQFDIVVKKVPVTVTYFLKRNESNNKVSRTLTFELDKVQYADGSMGKVEQIYGWGAREIKMVFPIEFTADDPQLTLWDIREMARTHYGKYYKTLHAAKKRSELDDAMMEELFGDEAEQYREILDELACNIANQSRVRKIMRMFAEKITK